MIKNDLYKVVLVYETLGNVQVVYNEQSLVHHNRPINGSHCNKNVLRLVYLICQETCSAHAQLVC